MPSRSDAARKVARCIGLRVFRGCWNLAELLNDCESVSWQLERTAPPDVKPGSIGYMAVKRVKIGRQFKQSIRSITTGRMDKRSKRPHIMQLHVHLTDLAAPDHNPADIAAFWIDYEAWLARLSAKKRKLAKLLATGESTRNAAKRFAVSDGRISQLRKELRQNWESYTQN